MHIIVSRVSIVTYKCFGDLELLIASSNFQRPSRERIIFHPHYKITSARITGGVFTSSAFLNTAIHHLTNLDLLQRPAMADEVEIDKFLEECEQRLRCHYVRPECAGPLPDAARSTRYLFPTSLHGVGIVAPNSAIELLLVADISPKTFWNEAEEVFEDATYRMSISKKKIHPATATASSDEKATVLLVESSERVIVLEYCQMQVADVLDVNGRIYFDAATKHPLLTRARDIQQLHDTDDLKAATFRQNTIRCIQLAHHSGMLSGRLNLLTHSQLANA